MQTRVLATGVVGLGALLFLCAAGPKPQGEKWQVVKAIGCTIKSEQIDVLVYQDAKERRIVVHEILDSGTCVSLPLETTRLALLTAWAVEQERDGSVTLTAPALLYGNKDPMLVCLFARRADRRMSEK